MKLEEDGQPELADRIAPYRAGYTPQQRREIEAKLASGDLLAVAATNALELGIDVGELDAAICVNFPGTVASLRQMWGRAGRRRRGLAVYVAGEDALDQFFCRHPDEFLGRPVEAAILDHRNEQIQMQHLVAAAYEARGGAVVYAGKPHLPVYDMAFRRAAQLRGHEVAKARTLAIGDGIRTDIEGAAKAGIRSVFVASGIHVAAGRPLDAVALEALFPAGAPRPVAAMTALRW